MSTRSPPRRSPTRPTSGRARCFSTPDPKASNRKQVDNGRTYLREIVFGDPEEPHHRDALVLTVQTENAIADVLRRDERISSGDAATLAHVVSAIMFVSMAATINITNPVDDIVQEISNQVQALLPR